MSVHCPFGGGVTSCINISNFTLTQVPPPSDPEVYLKTKITNWLASDFQSKDNNLSPLAINKIVDCMLYTAKNDKIGLGEWAYNIYTKKSTIDKLITNCIPNCVRQNSIESSKCCDSMLSGSYCKGSVCQQNKVKCGEYKKKFTKNDVDGFCWTKNGDKIADRTYPMIPVYDLDHCKNMVAKKSELNNDANITFNYGTRFAQNINENDVNFCGIPQNISDECFLRKNSDLGNSWKSKKGLPMNAYLYS